MERLGATQINPVWAWCGVNHEEHKVYFSVWTDNVEKIDGKPVYIVQRATWAHENGRKSAGRKDHDEKLELVFSQGYAAYAYFVEPKDRNADPREIAETRTSFVMEMKLSRDAEGCVRGLPVRRIDI